MPIDADSLITRIGLALAIGLAVGIVRGWQQREELAGQRTAGVRTYALSGLLGGISAALSQISNTPLILGIAFAVFGTIFAWFSYRETNEERTFSVTATVAALVVFALGALAILGDPVTAAATGAATAGLLASREVLHDFLQKLSWVELRSALLLLAMTVIVLPILPDKPVTTFDTLSPRDIWLLTVLTAGISFAGYLATKILGDAKSTLLTSIAGGLVSSTAVTIDFARRARSGEVATPLVAGAVLAGIISILRVLVIVLVVAPHIVSAIILPALVAAATLAIFAFFYWTRGLETGQEQMTLRNPFDLQPIVVFALTLLLASLASGWLVATFGTGGIMVSSASVALVDVDVAVLTASHFSHTTVGASEAIKAILLALAVNAFARVCYSIFTGPRSFFGRLAFATLSAIAVGTATLLAMT
jgi:uncharacterized membrane protein (DUF4010 family)